ncbi:MAG TPA: ABC transporter permease [Thermomicrobiales bacterium]|nr:ABC transporter permease [Thermomicrobiales bacterium]
MATTGKEHAKRGGGLATGGAAAASPSLSRLERASLKKSPGYFARSWRRFRHNKLALVSLIVFVLMVCFSFGSPLVSQFITHQDYATQDLQNHFAAPGSTVSTVIFGGPNGVEHVTYKHWLGTDELGRDVLTRLAYGGRISMSVSFIALALALTVGIVIGAMSGFYGGVTDAVLMRLVDVFLSIPGLFLLILISSMINNNSLLTNSAIFRNAGWLALPLVIASLSWTGISRLIRGEVMSVKSRDYIDAARVLGSNDSRIIFRHILPNVLHVIIIWVTLAIPGLILTEASLSYLGFGVQIPTPSWGNMLSNAQEYFTRAAYLVILPGMMIYITVLVVNLMGNGLRDALDPRLTD